MIRKSMQATLAVVLLVCGTRTLTAAVVGLDANLDGLQMVPPNASPAFGFFEGTLDDASGALTVTTGTYTDLLGGSISVFLNTGAAGTNGAFIFGLTNDTPGAATGTFSGGGILNATQIADMLAGNTYLRVTSSVFPGGEIRGQIGVVPEPSTLSLVAIGLAATAAFVIRRRRIHVLC
jgi:hypothetical protein